MKKVQKIEKPSLINKKTRWGILFLIAILISIYQTGIFQKDIFNPGGLSLLWQFLSASYQPDLTPEFLKLTLDATITTLAYAVCGTFLSILIGIIGGIFTSRIWWLTLFPNKNTQNFWLVIRGLLAFPRAIHEAIWGLILINIWGLDSLTAIVAIAIPFGAIVSKVFSEILDETPRKPLMALLNSGVAPLMAFFYTLIPQAFLNLISYTFYRFECSLRSASILGIIGAGGLGYQIFLSLQSLKYQQLWTLFYALILLNGIVDISSALLRERLGFANRIDLNYRRLSNQNSSQNSPNFQLKQDGYSWIIGLNLGLILLVPFCFWYIAPDISKITSPRSLKLLGNLLKDAFPLEINLQILQELLTLSGQTLGMSILAISIAGIGGILLSFPAAHNFFLPGGLFNPNYHKKNLNLTWIQTWLTFIITRLFLLICRSIPAPIGAFILLLIFFPGILPGAMALGFHNLGILGRLMAEVTENVEKKPIQSLKVQGISAELVFLYGVLPITLPRFFAYILYRWEVCLRETIIVGLVGAGGLGRLLTEQSTSFDYAGMFVTLGCFMILTFLVDWVSGKIRK